MMEQNNKLLEKIINWTLPGLGMYYRDTNLSQSVINKYEVGKIFRSPTFVDVSNYAGKPTMNCRFIFASSHANPLFKINPATKKWGFNLINRNSFFKVLDVYKKENITQISLLHIPYEGIDFFSNAVLQLGEQNIEEQIIGKLRESLNLKIQSEISTFLNEKEWIDRTNFPIGLDNNNEFFSLEPEGKSDLTDLNETPDV